MAIKFLDLKYAEKVNQDWLNGAGSVSLFARVRFDTVDAKQYVISHRGPSGQISLRRDSTTTKLKASVTAGAVVLKDGSAVVAAGTTYAVAMIWKKNDANGLRLFEDGVEVGSGAATTTQAADYTAGGAPSIHLARRSVDSDYGKCTIERLLLAKDHELSQEEINALGDGAWPGCLPVGAAEHLFLPCFEAVTDYLQDYGTGGVHFSGTEIVGATDGGALGIVDNEDGIAGDAGDSRAGITGDPEPAAWTEWGSTITHPDSSVEITGLTPGDEYEFMVKAEDAAGNLSAESAVVSAVARSSAAHVPRKALLFTR